MAMTDMLATLWYEAGAGIMLVGMLALVGLVRAGRRL
jgi:hypothetical protein